MNKAKKNVVVVGFSQIEKNSLALPLIDNKVVHYIDSIKEARRYQGYLLLIDNKNKDSIIKLDKKYRKIFNKYELIWLYNESYDCYLEQEKWSRIQKIDRDIFKDIDWNLGEDWDQYKKNKESNNDIIKFSQKKYEQINKLYNYLIKYKTIKTEKIANDLKMNKRTIQRYMNDINNIYHSVGYDYSLNEWYFIW